MPSSVRHTTFDAADAYAQATFWAEVVGGRVSDEDAPGDEEALVVSDGPPLLFVQVPDAKTVKNRVHLDLQPEGTRADEVRRLTALGATVVDDRTRPDGRGWVVMADPEGNEFCVERGPDEAPGVR